METETRSPRSSLVLNLTRLWLPVLIAVAGVVLIVLGHASVSDQFTSRSLEAGIGVGLLIVAVIVWMISWMFRLSLESNQEREVEERAREYFDVHGRWPEDEL